MKLTTLNSNARKTGTEKITNLKKMIQSAANQASNHKASTVLSSSENIKHSHFPKHVKTPFIKIKQTSQPSFNDDKENISIKANGYHNFQTNIIQKKQTIKSANKDPKEQGSPLKKILKKSQSNFDITKSRLVQNKSYKMLSRIRTHSRVFSMIKQFNISMFRLGRKLGRGRFGNVYMAQEIQSQFILAIKVINKKQLKQSKMEDQLLSQIKLQMYMNHPNILKMYGVFHDEKNIYILLELAQQCLFRTLKRHNSFPENKAAYYIKQVTQSLKYLHSEYIIHRDIKPENIMVVNDVAKLGDFGWSTYSPLYKRNTFCGTLDYVPPEIIQGQFYDEKVDIWSLGILIYELTTGSAPFEDHESEDATFLKIMEGSLNLPQKMSYNLRQLVQKILVKNPKERIDLSYVDESNWLREFEKEGRSIFPQIWQYWQSMQK